MTKDEFDAVFVDTIGYKIKECEIYNPDFCMGVVKRIRCGFGVFGKGVPHLETWEKNKSRIKRFMPCTGITLCDSNDKEIKFTYVNKINGERTNVRIAK